MNIEIANRLHSLRKANNLSQEELADRIGVSRQAVSKWERAESSPDTANLILLSKLYNVSIDDMLKTEDPPVIPDRVSLKKENYNSTQSPIGSGNSSNNGNDRNNRNNDEEIYPQFSNNPYANPQNPQEEKHIPFEKKLENGFEKLASGVEKVVIEIEKGVKKAEEGIEKFESNRPESIAPKKHEPTLTDKMFPLIMVTIFLMLTTSSIINIWSFSTLPVLLLLCIPMYYTTKKARRTRNPNHFCYPIFVTMLFLATPYSFMRYTWPIFITIPIYYTAIAAIKKRNPGTFCYPALVAYIYCSVISIFSWAASIIWPIFLTIPFYYIAISHFMGEKKKSNGE